MKLYFKMLLYCIIVYEVNFFGCYSNYMLQYYCIDVRVWLIGMGWNIGYKVLCYFIGVSVWLIGMGLGVLSVMMIVVRCYIRNFVDMVCVLVQIVLYWDR